MRALVTGANGFIGRAVLAHEGHVGVELRAQVGQRTPADVVAGAARVLAADITDGDALRPLLEGVDVVIHLAGPAAVSESFAAPDRFLRAHVLGTATVVELCRELAVPRLVYVSSAEVYGRPAANPVGEDAPVAPRSPYAAAKVGAESVVGAAGRADGLDAVVLRPFSVYGPGQRAGGVVGLIMAQAIAADSIRLRDLGPVRDYVYVDDVAGAIWQAARRAAAPGPRPFNVASGQGTSVRELAELTLRVAGRDGSVEQVAHAEDRPAAADIRELVGDERRAREGLGWEVSTTLAEGLARTLAWSAEAGPRP